MLAQARLVALDNAGKNGLEATRFSLIASPMDFPTEDTVAQLVRAIANADARQHADAQPVPHRFSLTPLTAKTPARR